MTDWRQWLEVPWKYWSKLHSLSCQGCPKSDREKTTTINRSILPICDANLKPDPIEVILLNFSPFLYIEVKFGHLKAGQRTILFNRDQVFRKNSGFTLFDHKRNQEIWKIWKYNQLSKNEKIKIKLST